MRELRLSGQSSAYRGVSLRSGDNDRVLPWCAVLTVRKNHIFLGHWTTERAAAIAVDRARLHYVGRRGPFNFPKLVHSLAPAEGETLASEARRAFKETTTSQFRGVSRPRGLNAWIAQINYRTRNLHLGCFADEVAAARAYDRAARRLHGAKAKLNFP